MYNVEFLKNYDAEVDVEISELTDEEIKAIDREMRKQGFKYNRTEKRYETCIVAVYEFSIG